MLDIESGSSGLRGALPLSAVGGLQGAATWRWPMWLRTWPYRWKQFRQHDLFGRTVRQRKSCHNRIGSADLHRRKHVLRGNQYYRAVRELAGGAASSGDGILNVGGASGIGVVNITTSGTLRFASSTANPNNSTIGGVPSGRPAQRAPALSISRRALSFSTEFVPLILPRGNASSYGSYVLSGGSFNIAGTIRYWETAACWETPAWEFTRKAAACLTSSGISSFGANNGFTSGEGLATFTGRNRVRGHGPGPSTVFIGGSRSGTWAC